METAGRSRMLLVLLLGGQRLETSGISMPPGYPHGVPIRHGGRELKLAIFEAKRLNCCPAQKMHPNSIIIATLVLLLLPFQRATAKRSKPFPYEMRVRKAPEGLTDN